jgi:hypothetical protein
VCPKLIKSAIKASPPSIHPRAADGGVIIELLPRT